MQDMLCLKSSAREICFCGKVDLDGRALLLCAFIGWRHESDYYLERILGEERTAALNPIGTFERNGISVSFGSDAPYTFPDPILWIHKAVNHSNPPERVPVRSAVRMATWNGSYAAFNEQGRGSLEEGKVADKVILFENPYKVPSESIKGIRVEGLILGSLLYESAVPPLLSSIWHGLTSGCKY